MIDNRKKYQQELQDELKEYNNLKNLEEKMRWAKQYLNNRSPEEILFRLIKFDEGFFATEQYKNIYHTTLRWLVSDQPATLRWWHWLAVCNRNGKYKQFPSRDTFLIRIWKKMNDPDDKHHIAIQQVEEDLTDWSYYQNYFFNWFLQRFNIPAALEVLGVRSVPGHIYPVICAIITGIVIFSWICFDCLGFSFSGWFASLTAMILLVILLFSENKIDRAVKPSHLVQTQVPRLGVLTGIGYLFLLSAKDLVQFVIKNNFPLWSEMLISLILVAAVWVYLVQVIQRQVKPTLSFKSAWDRSKAIMNIAITYSAIGIHLCAPILTSENFLTPNNLSSEKIDYNSLDLLMMASLALAIGVVLQLVWEDKPVTEPL